MNSLFVSAIAVAYTVPDLDGKVRILIDSTSQNTAAACLETDLTNGKTVYQKAVGWTLAIVAGLALTSSAVASGLGFSNTAAHVAANALSLFSFFQAQAMYGMTVVTMPPIVEAWTQNFQWSMGIIRVGFLQTLSTWYQRSSGGTPSTLLDSLSVQSINVQKRSSELTRGASHTLTARADATYPGNLTLKGILRVGFRAKIESSNIFMTGLIFLEAFFIIIILLIFVFKLYIAVAAKRGWIHSRTFQEFRSGWSNVVRGILLRLVSLDTFTFSPHCLHGVIIDFPCPDSHRLPPDGRFMSVGTYSARLRRRSGPRCSHDPVNDRWPLVRCFQSLSIR
jgi:Transient receptor potential (TRP) ion channel/ML-like domain